MLGAGAQEKKESKKAEKPVNVPTVVKNAFASKFTAVSGVEWGIEKPGQYEVEFTQNKINMAALFDAKGALLETESKIVESELPAAIKSTLAKDFVGYKITNIEKTVAKGVAKYEMDATKGKKKMELVFDASGKLLKKDVEKAEGEKKD